LFHLGCLTKESIQVRGFLWSLITSLFFYREELLAPRPTPKLKDHPLSAVRDCLFNIFAVTLHIWRPSPPSSTWRHGMQWWQGTRLTLNNNYSYSYLFIYLHANLTAQALQRYRNKRTQSHNVTAKNNSSF
jgi:hypothetical protein